MAKTKTGDFTYRVTVYEPTTITANDGQAVESGRAAFSAWASIVYKGGREAQDGKQLQAQSTLQVTLRTSKDAKTITTHHWLVLQSGARLEINGVDCDWSRSGFVVLDCYEAG